MIGYEMDEPRSEHVKLEWLVDSFSDAMLAKLSKKVAEVKSGWDSPDWTLEDIKKQLISHIEKGDATDVANFAMFWWNKERNK